MPKIIAATRVRNESHIIGDVLKHVSKLVDGIVVLDDCSTDNTVDIIKKFPKVLAITHVDQWEQNPVARLQLEGIDRQHIYDMAMNFNPEWIYIFDGDEFADFEDIDFSADAYKLRLFDFYITPEDQDLSWKHRTKIGPEYRDITMLFRPHKQIRFSSRVPKLPKFYNIETKGSVKHYGKAISVDEWEKTCKYYTNHHAEKGISQKWRKRFGKAVHTHSDFGADLITWKERKEKGFKLVDNQI